MYCHVDVSGTHNDMQGSGLSISYGKMQKKAGISPFWKQLSAGQQSSSLQKVLAKRAGNPKSSLQGEAECAEVGPEIHCPS